MRRFILSVALLPLIAGVASADFFGSGSGFDIPDAGVDSSSIVVAGTTGTITDITVTLEDLTHTWAGDLIATLDNGTTSVDLFSRPGSVGGSFGFSTDLTGDFAFNDAGTDDYVALVSAGGTFDGTGFLFFPTTAEGAPSFLSDFNGQSKDGVWTLTISDNAGADVGSISGWTLNITSSVIPEPTTFGLIAGLAGLAVVRRRR